MRVIDIHAHAFPDELAGRAMAHLEKQGDIKGLTDGTVAGLLRSMDEAGVEISVVCSIATKPSQFQPILNWSRQIASDRIIPFPSVYPLDPDAAERVRTIRDEGFRGLKLHPYYQQFDMADERVWPVYGAAQETGLVVLMHTGFDLAYPRDRVADPARTAKVLAAFPDLKMVTTHLGAWEDWEESERWLLGRPVYMDPSYCANCMTAGLFRRFMTEHPADYLVYGSDSPWEGQKQTIAALRALGLGEDRERRLFWGNAARLLGL
mgnify:CR=1 FL=1